jgi:hypothetical protein
VKNACFFWGSFSVVFFTLHYSEMLLSLRVLYTIVIIRIESKTLEK